MFATSEYNPDSQPLCRVNGFPVYLTGILVLVHTLSMIAGAFAGPQWARALALWFPDDGQAGELWRYVTYNFIQSPSLWFLIEMFLLWVWGHQLERLYGRRTFGRLYAGLVLLPAVLARLLTLAMPQLAIGLMGTGLTSFCVLLAFCFTHPGAHFFLPVPWLTAKVVASALFAMYVLANIADRRWAMLGLFLANCAFTYIVLRRAGLTPRFDRLREAFSAALPSPRPRALPSPKRIAEPRSAATTYRPKIAPKIDLAPEKKAVQDIEELLDKIASHGINSLTPDERAALERASAKLRGEE